MTAVTQRPARPLAILLAEDDPIAQLVSAELLRQLGHRVEVVGDGRAAVTAIATGSRFDVVLMDLFMPELDGIAATRAIRALPGARDDLAIVALTAAPTHTDVDAALAAGMRAVIAKPLDAARLDDILMELVATPAAPEPADATPPPDCDTTVIKQLHEALGRDAVTAVMQGFLSAIDSHKTELERLVAGGPERAIALAHRLAGSAAVFGFRRLSQAFLELERALRAGEGERATAALARLPVLADAVQRNLR